MYICACVCVRAYSHTYTFMRESVEGGPGNVCGCE